MQGQVISLKEAAGIFDVSVVTMRRYVNHNKWNIRSALLQENKWGRVKFDKDKLKSLFTPDHKWVCESCKKKFSRKTTAQ